MCGIVGKFGGPPLAQSVIARAVANLAHRGPDDSGFWEDSQTGIALGHTRLSILDLSAAGHQPMMSACSRYVISFNGEIYNHVDLRRQLGDATPQWRGHSDTESLLACFSTWGIERTLQATVGMFALALWDQKDRKLILARDRLGEKPLYYGFIGGMFAFASELKGLASMPDFSPEIDRGALALLLRHSHVPAPYCIYSGLAKLAPGSWIEISSAHIHQKRLPSVNTYWSALEAATAGAANPLEFESDMQATAALESELSRAIAGQTLSDVPIGAFLSGGVDSSTVVAIMQAQANRPVKTFSIGFREDSYNEAKFAGAVARHLGTEHTELYVSHSDALQLIPQLPTIYDEPFSDASQIPTHLVARLARHQVTVALSGDGGDELFGGYTRYFLAARLWKQIERMPHIVRRAAGSIILTAPPNVWNKLYRLICPFIPNSRRWPSPGEKLHKGAPLLSANDGMSLYRGLMSHWDPEGVVRGAREPDTVLSGATPALPTLTERMMLLDALTYLPDDILVKLDRAAMAISLETRVPLIDHRVFEFAWKLPLSYKVRGGVGKWLLRQVLYKYLPAALVDRPKMGFGVPIDSWLRGPLREWMEELLSEERLKREGYLNPGPIRKKLKEHLSGQCQWQYHLWDVLMFQAWLEKWRK